MQSTPDSAGIEDSPVPARKAGIADATLQDFSFALRQLRRSPGFAAVAILTLALGIGANSAIFTLINTVMLTRLPVVHPEQLVVLHWNSHSSGPYVWNSSSSYGGCETKDAGSGRSNCSFSYPVFDEIRSHARSFQGVAAYAGGFGVQLDRNGHSTRASGQYVSGDFFSVLGVHPLLGRTLLPSDDKPGAAPAVMLEYNYWRSQFGADPSIVGESVDLSGVSFAVVGVAPPEFFGILPGSRTNLWAPIHARDLRGKQDSDRYGDRSIWLYIIARLQDGSSLQQARAESDAMFRANLSNTLASIKPEERVDSRSKKSIDANLSISITSAARGLSNLRTRFSTQLMLLMGVTGLVLLIACANIANLLLARASARRKEIAVRLAIGAGRGRLLRQLLTESLLLALLGCATGLLVSYWASRAIVLIVFRHASAPLIATFRPGLPVFAFSAAVSVIAAVVFGLVPALTSTRVPPGATLKAAGGSASDAERRNRLGRALVAAEVAVALVLIIGAGLFLRTLIHLETLNPGFRVDKLLTVSISTTSARIPDDRVGPLVTELNRRLAALPGVAVTTWSSDLLAVGDLWTTGVNLQERPDLNDLESQAIAVGPGFFETLQIPLLAGRTIQAADCKKDATSIWVNQAFVNRFVNGANVLGMHIVRNKKPAEIVGIVGNTKFEDMKSELRPAIFIPNPGGDGYFQIRTAADPASLENAVRGVLSEVSPNTPIITLQTLRESMNDNLASENAMARLSSAFGLLALLLAAIGVYGVLAYSVARRTSEIAIRMSLGAMPANILRQILSEGLRPALLGALVGLLGSWGLTRLVAQFLYGVKALDGVTFVAATLALLLIAALACFVPARRAMRVAPMVALRYE